VALADREAELERLRAAIGLSRERVGEYEREHRGLLEVLESMDLAAIALTREVALSRRAAEVARAELIVVETEASEIEARLHATEAAMKLRAVALYKSGDVALVRTLFSAGGIREFLARTSALKLLLRRDAELLERHQAESAEFEIARERARIAAATNDAAAEALRTRKRELAAERSVKRQLVAKLHDDRTRERAALVELEQAARALEETLENLQREPAPSLAALGGPPFESLQHRLAPPVDRPITGRFGRVIDEEFFTETYRSGVVFGAQLGDPVRAVAAGHVRYAGWFRGFGRLVILDHGDSYFTVSGHLSEMYVDVGARVGRGDTIGAVGETGSLTGPQLYFEVRLGADPLDPTDWLQSANSR
jgi:septal ring factor EnvC (AmiA/AmiB activator)